MSKLKRCVLVIIAAVISLMTFAGCSLFDSDKYGTTRNIYQMFGDGKFAIKEKVVHMRPKSYTIFRRSEDYDAPLILYMFEYKEISPYVYAIGSNDLEFEQYRDYLNGKDVDVKISYLRLNYDTGISVVWDDLTPANEDEKAIYEELCQQWETRLKNGEGVKLHK